MPGIAHLAFILVMSDLSRQCFNECGTGLWAGEWF